MAAIENVSKLSLRPAGRESILDVRNATLPEERPPISDYDPMQHREPKQAIKVSMAYFNILRTLFGAGILALPLATGQVGLVLGPIMAIATGGLILHSQYTLLWCLNEISRQLKIPCITYTYGFRIALLHGPRFCQVIGSHGPIIIAVFMVLSQIGICTVFVIFTSDSLRDAMDWSSSRPAQLMLFFPYMFLQYYMKTLKQVSYVSMAGNIMNLIGLILVTYNMVQDDIDERMFYTTNPYSMFYAFGLFLFNMSSVAVILAIDKALEDPKLLTKRCGIMQKCWLIATVLGTLFGVLGSLSYGTIEENVLRSLPLDDNVTLSAISLYLIAIVFAYPIQCYPAIQLMMDVLRNHKFKTPLTEAALETFEKFSRPLFVLVTFLIGYIVPFQGPFVAFVANLCTSLLVLVFPSMMELCLLYPKDYGKYKFYLIKNVLIIVLGLATFVVGVAYCGYLLYIRILAFNSPHEDIGFFR